MKLVAECIVALTPGKPMFIYFDETGSIDALTELLDAAQNEPSVGGVILLAATENGFTPETVDHLLTDMAIPLFGGIFPAIIYQGRQYNRGTIVAGLPTRPKLAVIRGIGDGDVTELEHALVTLGEPMREGGTALCWIDGLARHTGPLLEAFHNQFGLTYNVIGGGAGSLELVQTPCIFSNEGLLSNAAVLAVMDLPSGVAAKHGWVKLSGPYHVTKSSANVIHSLNWRPALEVYSAAINVASTEEFQHDRFYEMASNFPFGIQRYGVERVVRDPILVDGESLVCLGDVPEGALVDILTATDASLLIAADAALLQAENQLRAHGHVQTVLIVDCVSRMMFLQDGFQRELVNLHYPGADTIGVLSLGEFACNGRDYPSFLNKTAVVGMFSA